MLDAKKCIYIEDRNKDGESNLYELSSLSNKCIKDKKNVFLGVIYVLNLHMTLRNT